MNPSSRPSILLILSSESNHQQAVLDFIADKQLLASERQQTNIQWINDNGAGIKINQVRELIGNSSFGPYTRDIQLFVLLHSEQSSIPAQNALLKIIEEPPANTLIILTASQPQQLLSTICSRCTIIKPEQAATPTGFSPEISKLAQQISHPGFNSLQAMEIAEQYKKREDAQELLKQLIIFFHAQLTNKTSTQLADQPRSRQVKTLQTILAAAQDLQHNLNPQLTLEHYFFKLT
jgi:hypothetical protein